MFLSSSSSSPIINAHGVYDALGKSTFTCSRTRPHSDELANAVTEAEAKAPEDLTEQDKMALLGRPKSGDIVRAQLRIKESKEFKVNWKKKNKEKHRTRLVFFSLLSFLYVLHWIFFSCVTTLVLRMSFSSIYAFHAQCLLFYSMWIYRSYV